MCHLDQYLFNTNTVLFPFFGLTEEQVKVLCKTVLQTPVMIFTLCKYRESIYLTSLLLFVHFICIHCVPYSRVKYYSTR